MRMKRVLATVLAASLVLGSVPSIGSIGNEVIAIAETEEAKETWTETYTFSNSSGLDIIYIDTAAASANGVTSIMFEFEFTGYGGGCVGYSTCDENGDLDDWTYVTWSYDGTTTIFLDFQEDSVYLDDYIQVQKWWLVDGDITLTVTYNAEEIESETETKADESESESESETETEAETETEIESEADESETETESAAETETEDETDAEAEVAYSGSITFSDSGWWTQVEIPIEDLIGDVDPEDVVSITFTSDTGFYVCYNDISGTWAMNLDPVTEYVATDVLLKSYTDDSGYDYDYYLALVLSKGDGVDYTIKWTVEVNSSSDVEIPDNATELELDTEYTVDITDGGNVWYTYTPDKTWDYVFEAVDLTDGDPYVYLYNENGDQISYDDDSGEDFCFSLRYTLEAGVTYYYRASTYGSTASYAVHLYERPTVEEISVVSYPDEFVFDNSISMNGAVLELSYTDGSASELTITSNGTSDEISDEKISYIIYDTDGEEYYSGDILIPGTYTVAFYAENAQSEECTFTVVKPDSIAMELDTEYAISVSDNDCEWFSYTSDDTVEYIFASDDITTGDSYAEIYSEEFQRLDSNDDGGNGYNFLLSYTLESGETYYFKAAAYDLTEYTVSLYKSKTIESIEVISYPEEFTLGDTVSMVGAVLELTYADGTTSELTLDSNGTLDTLSADRIYYDTFETSGEMAGYDYDEYAVGTYTVVFYTNYNSIESEGYEFTVILPDAMEIELNTEYDVSVTDGVGEWFAYTPDKSRKYVFEAIERTSGDPYVYLYDESGWLANNDDSAGDYCFLLEYTLKAGKTYYFKTSAYENGSAEYTVYLYNYQAIDNITVESIPTEFVIGNTVSMEGAVLELTYEDETTSTLEIESNGTTSSYNGEEVYYNIYDESGELVSDDSLTVGTYTVVFYTDNVQSEAGTFEVVYPDSTLMELDTEYAVSVCDEASEWYSYTPDETGEYVFVSRHTEGESAYSALYDEDFACLDYEDYYDNENFYITYTLEEGKTYYYKVYVYESDIITGYTVSLCKSKTIESITVESYPDEYTLGDSVSMDGAVLEFTYTDGSTSSYEYEYDNREDLLSGEEIYFNTYNENGVYAYYGYSNYAIGTYTVVFYSDYAESEEYEFTVSAPDATEIELDTEYSVSVATGEAEWFSYTPDETWKYVFEATNLTYGDPYAYLYDESGYLSANDDGGDGLCFSLSYTLEAGVTYYYKAKAYNNGTATYSAYLYKCPMIESVSVVSYPDEVEFGDVSTMTGAVLELSFTDGYTSEVTIEYDGTYVEYNGEYISYTIYDADEEAVSYGYEALEMGSYTVVFYAENAESDAINITVVEPDVTPMELDTEYTVNVSHFDSEWYSYTPEETKKYIYTSSASEDYPYAKLYDESFELLATGYCGADDIFYISYTLEAGKTYYFRNTADNEDAIEYSVSLSKCPPIESITVISYPDEYTLGDTVSMDGAVLELTYTNGNTSLLTYDSYDRMDLNSGEYIYYDTYDENGDIVSYNYNEYAVGTYTVAFRSDYAESEECTFTVSAPDATPIELDTEYTVSIAAGEEVWFSYTPETTWTYVFEAINPTYGDSYGYLYGEDGRLDYDDDSAGDFCFMLEYTLEAGKTYYFKAASFNGGTAEYSVYLYTLSQIDSIAVNDMPTEFVIGETVSMEGAVLKLTYEDGSTDTLEIDSNGTNSSYNGETVYYDIYDEDGDYVSAGDCSLEIGTYTVVFYTDNVQSEACTFDVVIAHDVTKLELDKEYSVNVDFEADGLVYFSFTPEESGEYVFVSYDIADGDPEVYLYDGKGNCINVDLDSGEDVNFLLVCELTAGSTYYFNTTAAISLSSYAVKLSKRKTIDSMELVSLPAYEFSVDDVITMDDAVLEIEYTDETTSEFIMSSSWPIDIGSCEAIIYKYHLVDESGDTYYTDVTSLPAGVYTVEFYVDNDDTCYAQATIYVKEDQELSVSIEDSSIVYGNTTQITADGIGTITYSSSDTGVVTVSSTGKVTATGAGIATITVTAAGDNTHFSAAETISITVTKADQTMTASIADSSIVYGNTSKITAGGIGTISYSSSDTSVATVSSTGVVTATGVGTAEITVTAAGNSNYNFASETISVTVTKADQTVTASIASSSIVYGNTSQITASGEGAITYSSSDTSVATVSSTGLVTATGVGTAAITVTATGNTNYNSATKTISVTVTKASQTLTASIASSSIAYGGTSQITADGVGTITYSSSDTSIATVSSTGLVTAAGVGTATITVKAAGNSNYNSATKTISVTVTKLDQVMTVSIASSSIAYGGTSQITADGIGTITYTSSDTSIATVSNTGLVTAAGVGTATITVTAAGDSNYNSATEKISVTVTKADQTLAASIANSSIACGYTSQITTDGVGTIAYSSSDESIATVDSTGLVTAVSVGDAVITIAAAGDDNTSSASTTIDITVTEAVTNVGNVDADLEGVELDDTDTAGDPEIVANDVFEGEFFESDEGQTFVEDVIDPLNSEEAELSDVVDYVESAEDGSEVDISDYSLLTDVFDLKVKVDDKVVENVTNITVSFEVTGIMDYMSIMVIHYNTKTHKWESYTSFIIVGNFITLTLSSLSPVAVIYSIRDISDCDVSLGYTSAAYTGSALEPDVTIDGLTAGTDYTVSYEDNTDIGTATVTVTGIGQYTGTYETTFEITKADQTISVSAESDTLECDETTQITATGTGDITYSSSDESVATVSETGLVTAVGVGTATITVTAAGDDTTEAASETITITVTEAEITYLLGDVNRDGEVTYLDAMMVLRYDAMLIDLEEDQKLAGDVNGDGEVSSLDAIKILRMDAGLITEF